MIDVSRMKDDEDASSICGHDSLRSYVSDALRRAGDVRYIFDGTYVGTDAVILVYTCRFPDGSEKSGADSMRLDADGKVVEWKSHYAFDVSEADEFISR